MLLLCLLTAAVFSASAFAEGENAASTDPAATDPAAEEAARQEAAERGLAAIMETRFPQYLVLPREESYLREWKTGYARKAFKAPCLRVERISQLKTGRQVMPYIYEGVEATVVAEENNMSCMIYRGNDNKLYAGWIQSVRLLEEFPGEQYSVGKEPEGELSFRDDITVDWSRKSWLNTQQNYSVLSEALTDCVGFTLEYQIISENTDKWACIFGPRAVYVNDGSEWIRVGTFDYPNIGFFSDWVYKGDAGFSADNVRPADIQREEEPAPAPASPMPVRPAYPPRPTGPPRPVLPVFRRTPRIRASDRTRA